MVSDGLHSRSGVSETVRMMSYDENKAKRTPQWTQKPKTCFRGLRFGCLTVESVLYRYMVRIRVVRTSDLYALPHKSFPGRKTHLLARGNVYGRCVYRTVVAKLADRHFQHSRLYFRIVISKIWHLLCSSAEAQRGSNLMNRSDFFFIVNL